MIHSDKDEAEAREYAARRWVNTRLNMYPSQDGYIAGLQAERARQNSARTHVALVKAGRRGGWEEVIEFMANADEFLSAKLLQDEFKKRFGEEGEKWRRKRS